MFYSLKLYTNELFIPFTVIYCPLILFCAKWDPLHLMLAQNTYRYFN